jgi:hypothetical protein
MIVKPFWLRAENLLRVWAEFWKALNLFMLVTSGGVFFVMTVAGRQFCLRVVK